MVAVANAVEIVIVVVAALIGKSGRSVWYIRSCICIHLITYVSLCWTALRLLKDTRCKNVSVKVAPTIIALATEGDLIETGGRMKRDRKCPMIAKRDDYGSKRDDYGYVYACMLLLSSIV